MKFIIDVKENDSKYQDCGDCCFDNTGFCYQCELSNKIYHIVKAEPLDQIIEDDLVNHSTYSDAKRYCMKFGLTTREIFSKDPRFIARALNKAFETGQKQSDQSDKKDGDV